MSCVAIAACEDDVKRELTWSLYFFEKWGELPNKRQQRVLESALKKLNRTKPSELVKNEVKYRENANKFGTATANKIVVREATRMLVQEIFKACTCAPPNSNIEYPMLVDEACAHVMLPYEVIAAIETQIEKEKAAAAAAAPGLSDVLSIPTSAAYHEDLNVQIGDKNLRHRLHLLVTVASLLMDVLFYLIACVIAAAEWIWRRNTQQTNRSQVSPESSSGERYCSVEIGDIQNSNLSFRTYLNGERSCREQFFCSWEEGQLHFGMNSDQQPIDHVQLRIWDEGKEIHHFQKVFGRDGFGVVKNGGVYTVVHCKGSNHAVGSGKVEFVNTTRVTS